MEMYNVGKLSVDQALMKAKSHVKKDEVIEAKKLYKVILQAFPKNLTAHQGFTALNKTRQNNITQSPPQEAIDQSISQSITRGNFQLWLSKLKLLQSNIQRHLSFGIYWGHRQLK